MKMNTAHCADQCGSKGKLIKMKTFYMICQVQLNHPRLTTTLYQPIIWFMLRHHNNITISTHFPFLILAEVEMWTLPNTVDYTRLRLQMWLTFCPVYFHLLTRSKSYKKKSQVKLFLFTEPKTTNHKFASYKTPFSGKSRMQCNRCHF